MSESTDHERYAYLKRLGAPGPRTTDALWANARFRRIFVASSSFVAWIALVVYALSAGEPLSIVDAVQVVALMAGIWVAVTSACMWCYEKFIWPKIEGNFRASPASDEADSTGD
jgi:hypothetical protein